MSFTTRPPSYDVEKLFPFLKGTARSSIRLHPRRKQNLKSATSKIGGTFLWPTGLPHPVCPEKGCLAVPVLQLLKKDFPQIEFPKGTDVFQMLWYPQTYKDWNYNPKVEIHWRKLSELRPKSVIQPEYKNHEEMYVIRECAIKPEEVIEYPYIGSLTEEQQRKIWKWEEDNVPSAQYQYCLSTCPGTKIGGYPDFSGQDVPSFCKSNGTKLDYLLTVSDSEWDGGSFPRWRPIEQECPPGKSVTLEQHSGGAIGCILYTPEEKEQRKRWTSARMSKYNDSCSPLGIYLKSPLNLFIDKSNSPWTYITS